MRELEPFTPQRQVALGDDTLCPIVGQGKVVLQLATGSTLQLYPVMLVLALTKNLLSTISLGKLKLYRIVLEDDEIIVTLKTEPNRALIKGKPDKGLILLDARSIKKQQAMHASSKDHYLSTLWHNRLGHPSRQKLQELIAGGLATGIPHFHVDPVFSCEPCIMGKQEKLLHNRSQTRAEQLLQLVHTDVCRPMENQSLGGSKYYVTFIDDKSHFTCIYFLRKRSEVFEKFKEYLSYAERQTRQQLQVLRSDNGGEYVSEQFNDFYKQNGIHRNFSITYTPQRNGVAEKRNKDLNNATQSLLHAASLPKVYWAEGVVVAVHTQNRLPSKKIPGFTPFELWTGQKPDLKHLKVFGCLAYAHVPDQLRRKWDPKSERLMFIGYSNTVKGFKLINPQTRKVIYARNVIFKENEMWMTSQTETRSADFEVDDQHDNEPEVTEFLMHTLPEVPENVYHPQSPESLARPGPHQPVPQVVGSPDPGGGTDSQGLPHPSPSSEMQSEENDESSQPDQGPRRSTQNRPPRELWKEPPLTYGRVSALDYEMALATDEAQRSEDPATYQEAISSKKVAIQNELNALLTNDTWSLVPLPPGRHTISSKWVFHTKFKADGSLQN